MNAWLLMLMTPALLQGVAMLVDEGHFHRVRGLPRWERLGHPLDTLTALVCYGFLLLVPPTPHAALGYAALCLGSCLFITKDEFVHAALCKPAEGWLHAVLFVLHPVVFLCFGLMWWSGQGHFLVLGEAALTMGFMAYQLIYWQLIARSPA